MEGKSITVDATVLVKKMKTFTIDGVVSIASMKQFTLDTEVISVSYAHIDRQMREDSTIYGNTSADSLSSRGRRKGCL